MERKRRKFICSVFVITLFVLIPSLLIYAGGGKELQGKLDECNEKSASFESENSELKSQIDNLKSQNESCQAEVKDLEEKKLELENKIAAMEAEIEKWVAELKSYGLEPEEPTIISKTIEETLQQKDAQIVDLEADVEQINRELAEKNAQLAQANWELEQVNRKLDQAKGELDQTKRKLSQVNTEAEHLKIENSLYRRKLEDATQENQELQEALKIYEIIQEESLMLMDIALERIQEVLKEEIESGQVRVFKGTLGIILDVVSEFMFDTGSVALNPGGKVILSKIASLLDEIDGYFIGVIGNADSKRIVTPELKEKYPTNWELSSVRGAVVVRYLLDNSHISPGRMIAMGLGEYQPIDNNATERGRGNNRRIDIVLLPIDTIAVVVTGAEIK